MTGITQRVPAPYRRRAGLRPLRKPFIGDYFNRPDAQSLGSAADGRVVAQWLDTPGSWGATSWGIANGMATPFREPGTVVNYVTTLEAERLNGEVRLTVGALGDAADVVDGFGAVLAYVDDANQIRLVANVTGGTLAPGWRLQQVVGGTQTTIAAGLGEVGSYDTIFGRIDGTTITTTVNGARATHAGVVNSAFANTKRKGIRAPRIGKRSTRAALFTYNRLADLS